MANTCKTCNIEFVRPKYPNNIFKYCSRACMGKNIDRRAQHSLKMKGKTAWNKGTKGIMKKNTGTFKNGIHVSVKTEFKKGNISPWKGKKLPYPNGRLGKKCAVISQDRKDEHKMRSLFRVRMQKSVFERDDYTCQLCGIKGADLQVDHIQAWAEYTELRFDIDNCRTLCSKCHYQITFGKPMPPTVRAWGHNLMKGGYNLE